MLHYLWLAVPVQLHYNIKYIRTIERNADMLLNACKDTGSALNTGKTKCMEAGRHRGRVSNEHMPVDSNYNEKVKIFRYVSSY